jgi:hypothetical protein
MSLTIIKCISANKTAIPLVVIVPRVIVIGSWFYNNITGYKLVIVSLLGYTNKGICLAWLDYFI